MIAAAAVMAKFSAHGPLRCWFGIPLDASLAMAIAGIREQRGN